MLFKNHDFLLKLEMHTSRALISLIPWMYEHEGLRSKEYAGRREFRSIWGHSPGNRAVWRSFAPKNTQEETGVWGHSQGNSSVKELWVEKMWITESLKQRQNGRFLWFLMISLNLKHQWCLRFDAKKTYDAKKIRRIQASQLIVWWLELTTPPIVLTVSSFSVQDFNPRNTRI